MRNFTRKYRQLDTSIYMRTLVLEIMYIHYIYKPRYYTVKMFGLLQPYFGHLSCMPVVCVTHYKLQKDASYLNQRLRSLSMRIFLQKASFVVPLL